MIDKIDYELKCACDECDNILIAEEESAGSELRLQVVSDHKISFWNRIKGAIRFISQKDYNGKGDNIIIKTSELKAIVDKAFDNFQKYKIELEK